MAGAYAAGVAARRQGKADGCAHCQNLSLRAAAGRAIKTGSAAAEAAAVNDDEGSCRTAAEPEPEPATDRTPGKPLRSGCVPSHASLRRASEARSTRSAIAAGTAGHGNDAGAI